MPIIAPLITPWVPPRIGNYRSPSSLEGISRGIASLIEYNGLILNDRHVADRYIITDIAGMRDADVRDNRALLPSQDGEIAYQSFYGGRTITLTGKIRAGSYAQFQQMQDDLDAAFGTLQESPLKFRWWDVFDDFSDTTTLPYYAWTGNTPTVANGVLNPGVSPSILTHQLRSYGDSRVSMKVVVASASGNAAAVGPVMKYAAGGTTYLQAVATNTAGAISLVVSRYDANRGGLVTLATAPIALPAVQGMQFWIRMAVVDDNIVAELWTQDPFNAPLITQPFTSATVRMQGGDADSFGSLTTGSSGLISQQPTSGAWYVDDLRLESLWPGDQTIMCKKVAPVSIKVASQANLSIYETDFMVTLRASNPRFTSPFSLVQIVPPNAGVNYGRTYPSAYPYTYTIPIGSQGQVLPTYIAPNTAITNRGKWTALPIIRLYGQMQAPVVTNTTNGQKIMLRGVIADGDYVDIDIAAGTMVSSSGADAFNMLLPVSDWPFVLEPGDNYLTCASIATAGAANCLVGWRHSWL